MKQFGFYILVVFLMGCDRENYKRESLSTELEDTFIESKLAMSDFMGKWSKDSDVLFNKKSNELEANFHEIYEQIFNPFDYQAFGWTTGLTRFAGTKYIVVQSEIPYKIVNQVDTLKSDYLFTDTLKSFFPKVKFENVTTLHLNNDYQSIFTKFLGNPTNEKEREIFQEKNNFLNNTLTLSFGYNWRVILTHPMIDGISISKDFNEATVDFTILQSGLRSHLKKENNKWVIKTTTGTWIE